MTLGPIKFIDALFLLGTTSLPNDLLSEICAFIHVAAPDILHTNGCSCPNILATIILKHIDKLKPLFTRKINFTYTFDDATLETYNAIPQTIKVFDDYLCALKNYKRYELATFVIEQSCFNIIAGNSLFFIHGIAENSLWLVSKFVDAITYATSVGWVTADYLHKIISKGIELSIIITRLDILNYLLNLPFITKIIQEAEWLVYVEAATTKPLTRGYLSSNPGIYRYDHEIRWVDVQHRVRDDKEILAKILNFQQHTIPFKLFSEAIHSDNSDLIQIIIEYGKYIANTEQQHIIAKYVGSFSCNATVYIIAKNLPKTIDTILHELAQNKRGQIIDRILCLPFASEYMRSISYHFRNIVANSIRIGTVSSQFSRILDSLIALSGPRLGAILSQNNNETLYYLVWHILHEEAFVITSFNDFITHWFVMKYNRQLFSNKRIFLRSSKVIPSFHKIDAFASTDQTLHNMTCEYIMSICNLKRFEYIKMNLLKYRRKKLPFINELYEIVNVL